MPDDRQIDGMEMRGFLLGDAEQSGQDIVWCLQGNRPQAVKCRQWKLHLFRKEVAASTCITWSLTFSASSLQAKGLHCAPGSHP